MEGRGIRDSFVRRRTFARGVFALAAAGILVAVLVAPSAGAKGHHHRSSGSSKLFGLNYSFPEMTSKDARFLKKSGAKTVRWKLPWPRVEPSRGNFNWAVPDRLVGDLAAKGIRVLPILWGSPRWVASPAVTPPVFSDAAKNAWQAFLRAAVNRYGPNGAFWKTFKQTHHNKKPRPISTWEIWNEPNLRAAMTPASPEAYAKLLKISHSAIRDVDRHANVMFAGLLSHSPTGASAKDFLDRVYDQPGAKKDFDVAAIHAYASSPDDMMGDVHALRKVMNAHGDKKTPLWIAELGWGSDPKNSANGGQTKGLHGQKKVLKQSFKAIKKKSKRWNIPKALWFNFRDPAGGNTRLCAYCTSAGLLDNDYHQKPSWDAFRKFTR